MTRVRLYYFNIYSESQLLGSLKVESASKAISTAAELLRVDPETLTSKRVTSSEAAAPVEAAPEAEEKTTQPDEKPSTEEISAKRQITVDFSKSSQSDGQPTFKQLEAYNQLREDVLIWDNAIPESLKTVWKVTEDGVMIVKTQVTTKDNTIRKRKLVIRRGGAIHGYGKKPRGTEKLMTARADVIKYGFKESSLQD